MGNFNDYINNASSNVENIKEERPSDESLENLINEYQKLSNDELLNEFMRMTIEKKKKGGLTQKELDNMKNTLMPFLNNEQKVALQKLLDMVENVK